ncbi:hypothetical protein JJB09_04510 [Rhizobium sp. KVB221]|uniref:Uncharacterized protein n=1 Tax=Rhizobium setariae TaxID=2801340 RepID=A0A936YKJ8_9HYPH|nr:hypothetical protein [Rhizobium setariae]MBL0371283.1 hypothetical protein [Rhizobium setariae]
MKQLFAYFSSLTKGQQRFLLALLVMVLIPFSLLVGLQIYNAVNLAMLGNDLAVKERVWKAQASALDDRVDPESLKSPSNQFAYRLLAKHAELVPERRVVVTVQMPLGDLKPKKGNKITEDDLLNRAAENIQAMGESECALLIGTLATQCTVMSATGKPAGKQVYEYQLQLAFAEINPFGKSDPAARYEFIISKSSPGKAATRQRIYFENAARQRQRIYQDVADTCAAIRKKSGNCSVTGLSIGTRLDRGTPMVRLSASAAYASLVTAAELAASTH